MQRGMTCRARRSAGAARVAVTAALTVMAVGVVVAAPRAASAAEAAGRAGGAASVDAPAPDGEVNCVGDGAAGKRVQLVYARRRAATDRYAATAVKMRSWAPAVDQIFQQSAAKTGGDRQVRWAATSACTPTVLDIVVGNDVTTFAQLLTALKGQNLTAKDRKYLVAWDDADTVDSFCGLGQVMPDDKAGPTNNNETQPLGGMIAAVEPACWTGPLAAHELIHTLGAVQTSAPHATAFGHCTDGSDLLCYADGSGEVITKVCPTSQATLFDCNNDDYYAATPVAGSYLATHWNTATSGWLDPHPPPAPRYAPFASWAALVERQHRDVLGRPPTTAESSSWVTKLEAGTATRAQLVDSLRRSPENTSSVDPTARLYRAFLGRAPDAGGLEFWIGRRRAGTWTLTRMADSFASSSEFQRKYGTLTNRQFVTRIYTDVLGRTADPKGVDYWTGKLDRGERSRGGVMVGFSESSEYLRKQAQNTDVSVAYIFLLDRVPTAAETKAWVDRQLAGTAHTTLIEELLASREYAVRLTK
ncbi:MAG: hypothetical protein JWO77_82 [Ilumatobacteraceae bacterium]|nr:hypothetical protein [Ilumatobacteraceae bacterium]